MILALAIAAVLVIAVLFVLAACRLAGAADDASENASEKIADRGDERLSDIINGSTPLHSTDDSRKGRRDHV